MLTRKEEHTLQTRFQLKGYFRNGSAPNEQQFGYLIDSMSNKLDDGYARDRDHGLMLSPTSRTQRFISFFANVDAKLPDWFIGRVRKGDSGLAVSNGTLNEGLYLQSDGKVGVSNRDPAYDLDVGGYLGMKGRVGTFNSGEIPADGSYHTILEGLHGCQAYEVIARVGKKGEGKYALLQALAVSAGGRSYGKIRKLCASYGLFWNQLKIRWSGHRENYQLQLKSRIDYKLTEDANKVKIRYQITKLWDDALMP